MNQLLNLRKTQNKNNKKNTWEKILLIQKEIQIQATKLYSETYKPLWNTLTKLDCESEAQAFWKTMKKFRKQETDKVFPNIITNGTTSFTTKPSIKQAIAKYFKEVSLNKDYEAKNFINKFSIQQVTEPPSVTNNHQEPLAIEIDELTKSIQHQQNQKKGGPDSTTNECFKNLPEHMLTKLLSLLNACLKLKYTPYSWQKSITKLIHKKGNALELKNYRPIALLNSIFKIWEKILLSRMCIALDIKNIIDPTQFGSTKNIGSCDAILAMNLLNEANESTETFTATLDLSKAYNRVNRSKLWNKLAQLNTPKYIIDSIKSTYENHTETYKIGGETTTPEPHTQGLKQGSVLSPILFIIYVNETLSNIQKLNWGVCAPHANHANVAGLMFVDDLHIISNSMSGLLAIIEAIIEECSKQGIIINLNKSKILLNESQATQNADLLKNHEILKCFEIQNTGIYLGAHIQSGAPNTYAHIQKRMSKAHAAISEMKLRGFKIQTLGRKTINKIITSIIIPILTYGLEAFPVSTLNYKYLDNFVSKALHNTWNNQEEIDQSTTEAPLLELI